MIQQRETGSEVATPLVTLTPVAAEKVRALLEQENDPELGLRVFVAGGGCSGMQYGMMLDITQDDDQVVEISGVRVLVDDMSATYISGAEIDYLDGLMGAGF